MKNTNMWLSEESDIKIIFTIIFIVIIVILIPIIIAYPAVYYKCTNKYENSEYRFLVWCMVKYNNKYIPEELYEKAFTQNINLLNK